MTRQLGRAGWQLPCIRGVLCVALLLACSCATTLRPKFPIGDAGLALQRRAQTMDGLISIRAEARVDQRAQAGRIKGTVLMLVEHTGRVRFDVMTQFGPMAVLTSDGARFAYSDFRTKRFLTGDTCPANIARLLGVPLSAEDTARFLLGGTPVIAFEDAELRASDDGLYHVVLRAAGGGRQELDLATYPSDLLLPPAQQRLYLVRSELFERAGGRVWKVSYAEPALVSGPLAGRDKALELLIPMRVRIEQTSPASDTLVHFKTVACNPHIPDDAFMQTPRPGLLEEAATCE